MSVGVIREKKEQNLNLTLPEQKESGDLLEEEESLEGPLIDAESAVELSDLRQEVAKLRPADGTGCRTMPAPGSQRELSKELCEQQRKVRDAGRRSSRKNLSIRKLKKNQEKLKMQLEQMLPEYAGRHSFDI